MIIDMIGCLHGDYPKMQGGDLLIITGDLTAADQQSQYLMFRDWLREQPYKKKAFIAGNHDVQLENGGFYFNEEWMGGEYLNDSGTDFEGLKIWGSPWTRTFAYQNPHCMAFSLKTSEEIKAKWDMIPNDTDILVTHGPPFGVLDQIYNSSVSKFERRVGCVDLLHAMQRVRPKLHVFSHIHEGYGELLFKHEGPNTWCFNCSHQNVVYEPINPVMRVEL